MTMKLKDSLQRTLKNTLLLMSTANPHFLLPKLFPDKIIFCKTMKDSQVPYTMEAFLHFCCSKNHLGPNLKTVFTFQQRSPGGSSSYLWRLCFAATWQRATWWDNMSLRVFRFWCQGDQGFGWKHIGTLQGSCQGLAERVYGMHGGFCAVYPCLHALQTMGNANHLLQECSWASGYYYQCVNE